ncbi:hypothetical protein D1007_61214 [Hordeum vulgare]|nr:hypothetical protein D1007_61214 [Hordeum vulgare]
MHEDGGHLFVNCKEVKPLWRLLGCEAIRVQIEKSSIGEAMDVIWGLPEEQKMQIITLWWLWWQERNNVREGAIPCTPDVLAHRVKCTIAEYMACSLKPRTAPMSRALKWNPPADGIVKINSDGAYTRGENYGGWGVIARTSQGEVVAARAGCSDGIHDPFTAELKAMEEALNLAAELGLSGWNLRLVLNYWPWF